MIERFEKTHPISRKPTRILLLIGIGVLSMFVVINLATRIKAIKIFPLRTVTVVGNEILATDEILALTGLNANQSLLSIRKTSILKRLYRDKRIESAEVIKVYPNKLRILVSEIPPGVLIRKGSEIYISSSNGLILKEINNSEKELGRYRNFIEITLNKKNVDIKVGDNIGNLLVREAVTGFDNLEKNYPVLYRMVEDVVVENKGITLIMNSNAEPVRRVYLGFSVDRDKLEKLNAVLLVTRKIYKGKGSSVFIDLSSSYAAVMLKES